MNKTSIPILALFVPMLAIAEPIYLECNIKGEESSSIFNVKLDENTGKISHTYKEGGGFNADGFFTNNNNL